MLDKFLDWYINDLYMKQNRSVSLEQQGLYTKSEYYILLKPVVELFKENDSISIDEARNKLFTESNIMEKLIKFIHVSSEAPGMVIGYGTDNYKEKIVIGKKQEVDVNNNGNLVINEEPILDDTIFDLASVSKIFMSLSILKLIQNSIIHIDDEIVRYAPQFKNLRGVTVFDLLSFGVPLMTDERVSLASDRYEAEKILFDVKAEFNKETKEPYTDIGVMILRYVVEAVSGTNYYQFLKDNILDRLGMNDTKINLNNEDISRVVNTGYDGKIYNDGTFLINMDVKKGIPYDEKARIMGQNEGILSGHAGLFSTVDDMIKLSKGIINNDIIAKEYAYMMAKNRTGRKYKCYGTDKYVQYYGFLCFSKHPIKNSSFVPQLLSSHAWASIGWTGSQLVVDPVNRLYLFAASNRSHNRLTFIDSAYKDKVNNENGKKVLVLPNGDKMMDSTNFAGARNREVVNPLMELVMQYKMLEDIYKLMNEEVAVKTYTRYL